MQYTKPMIELVYEIRRRVPSDMKPGVKLANPELLGELAEHYHGCDSMVTRTLIKELLQLAGPSWASLLEREESTAPRQITRVYRGQVSLQDARDGDPDTEDKPEEEHTARRMYRGRPMD